MSGCYEIPCLICCITMRWSTLHSSAVRQRGEKWKVIPSVHWIWLHRLPMQLCSLALFLLEQLTFLMPNIYSKTCVLLLLLLCSYITGKKDREKEKARERRRQKVFLLLRLSVRSVLSLVYNKSASQPTSGQEWNRQSFFFCDSASSCSLWSASLNSPHPYRFTYLSVSAVIQQNEYKLVV